MPFVRPEDQNPKNKKVLGAAPQMTASYTAPAPTAGAANAGSGQQAVGSGKFVNFDRIFAANRGDAQNMAQGVTTDITNKAEAAKGGLKVAEQGFNQQVQSGTNIYGGPITGQAAGTGQFYGAHKSNGLDGQTQKTGSREDLAAKAQQGYSGPTDLTQTEGYQSANKQAQEASDNLNLTNDAYGLQTYAQNAYGKNGNYTNGMSVWDAALTNAAGAGDFAGLRKKYGGLDQLFTDAAGRAAQAVQGAQATSDDAQVLYGNDLQKYDDDFAAAQAASAKAQADAAARQAQQDAMGDNAGNGDLQNTTTSINDEKAAMNDGLYYEWLKAGRPPYEEWKASRGQGTN